MSSFHPSLMKQWTKLRSSFQIGPQNLKPFINYGNLISQGFFSFFFFQFWQHAQTLLSEYGNFTFFPPQNMVTLRHFYPKNSWHCLKFVVKFCPKN